ncbi:MAG: glycosyltransferase, partial [Polymorphobacter sp.]
MAYNAAATIADTLQSVAAQDYPLLEHLVIDGASTD